MQLLNFRAALVDLVLHEALLVAELLLAVGLLRDLQVEGLHLLLERGVLCFKLLHTELKSLESGDFFLLVLNHYGKLCKVVL